MCVFRAASIIGCHAFAANVQGSGSRKNTAQAWHLNFTSAAKSRTRVGGNAMASIGTAAAGATRRSAHPITNDDLAQLRGEHEPPCVSIYLPLQRAYPERHQGPV